MRRLVAAAAAITLLVTVPSPASAQPTGAYSAPLTTAINELDAAPENRTGYTRSAFRHWIDADRDGCDTRAEVLIEETLKQFVIPPGCAIPVTAGGLWLSYYDGIATTDPRTLDIDHMVPLAEAWDSGARTWTAQERQDYANDLGDPRALAAVTAKTNRSKSRPGPGHLATARPGCPLPLHQRMGDGQTSVAANSRPART